MSFNVITWVWDLVRCLMLPFQSHCWGLTGEHLKPQCQFLKAGHDPDRCENYSSTQMVLSCSFLSYPVKITLKGQRALSICPRRAGARFPQSSTFALYSTAQFMKELRTRQAEVSLSCQHPPSATMLCKWHMGCNRAASPPLPSPGLEAPVTKPRFSGSEGLKYNSVH